MKLVVSKIIAEFNKILGGTKRVGDSRKLDGKRSFELDVKNASTLGNKSESALNVNHSVYSDNSEKLRSVGIDGNPDVNQDGNPVFKTEQNLRVANAQTLQDIQPINLEVDISRRLKVGDQPDSPIISVSSLVVDPILKKVKDSSLLNGQIDSELEVKRAVDADNADLLNDTAQSELIVKEANQALTIKRVDGTLVQENDFVVSSAEYIRKGASKYDLYQLRDYLFDTAEARAVYNDLVASSNTLTTPNGNKSWAELQTIMKDDTDSEIYKASHLITDDSNNPVMTGAEVKDWIIAHADLEAKVKTLQAKLADRATTFGSATTNYDLDGMKALIIASVVDVATLAKNSQLLENKTTAEIITRMRSEVLVTPNITTDEAEGFFSNNSVKIEAKKIKADNAIESDTLNGYSATTLQEKIQTDGNVTSSKYLYRDPTNGSAGRIGYDDITNDIADLKTLLRASVSIDYNTLEKIEAIIKDNKTTAENLVTSEQNTRITKDNALSDRIDANVTSIGVERTRIDTIVDKDNVDDPDTFKKVKVVTDDHETRIGTNETAISDLEASSSSSSATLGNEVNRIETGAGLEDDGTYIAVPSGVIKDATSLKDADNILVTEINNEAVTRATNDATLQTNIDTEKARITQETTDRTTADDALDSKITTNTNAISDEVTNRTTAVSDEATARANADTALDAKITANKTDLATEVSDRTTAVSDEATLRANADSALDTKITANKTDLATESTARANADTALQADIDSNTSAISDEVTARKSAITSEETARTDADTALDTKITANKTDLATEVSDRTTAVSDEATARTTADDALGVRITANSDNLSAEILARVQDTATKVNKENELFDDIIINADLTCVVGTRYYIDVSNGAITVTLPEPTTNFVKIMFHGLNGDFSANNLTIDRVSGNTDTIMKSTEPLITNTNDETFTMVFVNNDWRVL